MTRVAAGVVADEKGMPALLASPEPEPEPEPELEPAGVLPPASGPIGAPHVSQ